MTAFINAFWPAIAWFGAIIVILIFNYAASVVSGSRDRRKSKRL
jgi:hypothetical protein